MRCAPGRDATAHEAWGAAHALILAYRMIRIHRTRACDTDGPTDWLKLYVALLGTEGEGEKREAYTIGRR